MSVPRNGTGHGNGHGKKLVCSDAPWDCLNADIEKQLTRQKHATIAKESALCSGSPDLHYT